MKKLITTVSLLMLTGCGVYVSSAQLENALSQCANNGGVAEVYIVNTTNIATREVVCNDGATFHVSKFKENNNE